jgi:hypothetical protein
MGKQEEVQVREALRSKLNGARLIQDVRNTCGANNTGCLHSFSTEQIGLLTLPNLSTEGK